MSVTTATPLIGKVALVTGASRSIGASITRDLANAGASVAVNYASDASSARAVVAEIEAAGIGRAVAIQADVSTVAGATKLLELTIQEFGKIDILVLNAGIMGSRVLADIDEDFFDAHMNMNVKAPLFLVKAAVPLLPSGGRVIFISTSLTQATTVLPNALTYIASKGAIEQASRALAKDLAPKGITVNVVSPGPVDTPLFRTGKPDAVIAAIENLNPQKRLGQPDEISPVVVFVASPAASWLTGQNIRLNGGFTV